ncbi:alpha-amylase family protein [Microvirga rosea]|uniref:hypothetical protein n=1 Tax=Microvirga rosea TaxID=2715425 RepID=UPI001D09A00C|nr:hypothetical protein [Microvirga rosea]MCB8822800.1 hypothetical protein [Microvirga rosea]
MRSRSWLLPTLIVASALSVIALYLALFGTPRIRRGDLVKGIVWQVDNATVGIQGRWETIGARQLLVQWTIVDNVAFVPDTGLPSATRLPDWMRISKEPWAKEVILGMAGRFSEAEARSRMVDLAALSQRLAQQPTPLNVVGWYFPVEVDPTWADASRMALLLMQLPRPLWISVYDSANVGADVLANWLASWLPPDVGVFFQDGVGVHARDASVARHYADRLANRLGASRVRIIAEAFRPDPKGGFRSAAATELASQIAAYDGYDLYLFDGPHYVSDALVTQLSELR